jgi:hypothetical protein
MMSRPTKEFWIALAIVTLPIMAALAVSPAVDNYDDWLFSDRDVLFFGVLVWGAMSAIAAAVSSLLRRWNTAIGFWGGLIISASVVVSVSGALFD